MTSYPLLRNGLAGVVLSIALFGCAQNPATTATNPQSPSLATQETSAAVAPAQLQADAEALWQRAEKEDSVALMQDAVGAYEQLLQLAPQDSSLRYQLYDGYYRLVASGVPGKEARMRELFNSLPAPLRGSARPPSLAVFLGAIETRSETEAGQPDDDARLTGLLLTAIREQPHEAAAYLLLADSYLRARHPALAVATVKQGLNFNPDHPPSQKYLGQAYRAFVRSQSCMYSYRDEIQKATESLRVASGQLPDDLKIREYLVDLYALMNLAPLSVNEARKLHAQRPDDVSTWLLAQALANIDQFEESDKLYESLAQRYPDVMYEALANNAALRGQWDNASHFWAKHFYHSREPSFYSALLRSVSDEQTFGQTAGVKIFTTLTESMEMTPWQGKLKAFRQGQLNADQLIAAATDSCERTEANFYAGYGQQGQGRKGQATAYFRAAVQQKTYSYQEYLLAHYFLEHPAR